MVNTRSMQHNMQSNSSENNSEFQDAQSLPTTSHTPVLSTQNPQNPTNYSVKLPQFWTSCPDTWFIQTELQFSFKGITDDTTKYQLVVISLSEDVLLKIVDIVHNPPITDKYNHIKKILIERFSLNEDLRLEKLLNESEIGDRKPSEFFHDLSSLTISNSIINNELLIKLWMRKLPPAVQMHLIASNLISFNEKLVLADKIYELSDKNQISSSNISTISPSSDQLFENMIKITSKLAENIDKLSMDISEIRNNNYIRTNNNSVETNDNYNRIRDNRVRKTNRRNLCWYHEKFGRKAMKCISPCNFVSYSNTQHLN